MWWRLGQRGAGVVVDHHSVRELELRGQGCPRGPKGARAAQCWVVVSARGAGLPQQPKRCCVAVA